MRTVQADSCLNSEQIDTRFISVGGQEGGWGGGGAFWAGDPNFTRVCQESFFFTPPGGTSVEVHIRGLAHYLQANNAFACQWCVIPPICTSTTSTQVETQSRLWFFLPQRVPSACRKSSHLPIWNIESLKVPFCGREVIYTRWQRGHLHTMAVIYTRWQRGHLRREVIYTRWQRGHGSHLHTMAERSSTHDGN